MFANVNVCGYVLIVAWFLSVCCCMFIALRLLFYVYCIAFAVVRLLLCVSSWCCCECFGFSMADLSTLLTYNPVQFYLFTHL